MDTDVNPETEKPVASKHISIERFINEIHLLLALNFFGLCGTMGRNGLVQLTAFENLGSVWPNVCGCFVIAFHPAVVGPELLVPIGVGFCGAMTSFSELITDVFLSATTPKSNWPNYGYAVPQFMARLILEISCCVAAYSCGLHCAKFYKYMNLPKLPNKAEHYTKWLLEVLGVLAWAACLVTSITSPNHVRWWALNGVFAPFGVWLRYYLSSLNDSSSNGIKYGTFIANVFATLVACCLQMATLMPYPSPLQKQILMGLQRGFCGCLSTISTFIKELETLQLAHAYIYGIVSLFVGYCFAVITIGSWKWTR